MNFIDNCPLCGCKLIKSIIYCNRIELSCKTKVNAQLYEPISHYKAIYRVFDPINNVIINKRISQHIYILPWSIDSFDTYSISRLYKHKPKYNGYDWKFIKELPTIKIDTEENMIKRINSLVAFL